MHAASPNMHHTGAAIRVRLHRWRLDHELAEGRSPHEDMLRAVRATQLLHPCGRRSLAEALRRAVSDAHDPRIRLSAVPLDRNAVREWSEALLGLAERLEARVAVNPCGVARCRLLLTDGLGPLYNRRAERTLGHAIWSIADGLQVCPPHRWARPVISKLDPEHVTWTCSECGIVASTDGSGVKPA